MNIRIAMAILLAGCPFATALADTGNANRYLNNTAAIQELVKGALEATIRLHTNKSTTAYYEIDGEIVEEWDA